MFVVMLSKLNMIVYRHNRIRRTQVNYTIFCIDVAYDINNNKWE